MTFKEPDRDLNVDKNLGSVAHKNKWNVAVICGVETKNVASMAFLSVQEG